VQAEARHLAIAMAHLQAQYRTQVVDQRLQFAGDQAQPPQAKEHDRAHLCPVPTGVCLSPGERRWALLDEVRHTFAKIFRTERLEHLQVGHLRGLSQRLEQCVIDLPLDHTHRAW
jgi:hypothetical protein